MRFSVLVLHQDFINQTKSKKKLSTTARANTHITVNAVRKKMKYLNYFAWVFKSFSLQSKSANSIISTFDFSCKNRKWHTEKCHGWIPKHLYQTNESKRRKNNKDLADSAKNQGKKHYLQEKLINRPVQNAVHFRRFDPDGSKVKVSIRHYLFDHSSRLLQKTKTFPFDSPVAEVCKLWTLVINQSKSFAKSFVVALPSHSQFKTAFRRGSSYKPMYYLLYWQTASRETFVAIVGKEDLKEVEILH